MGSFRLWTDWTDKKMCTANRRRQNEWVRLHRISAVENYVCVFMDAHTYNNACRSHTRGSSSTVALSLVAHPSPQRHVQWKVPSRWLNPTTRVSSDKKVTTFRAGGDGGVSGGGGGDLFGSTKKEIYFLGQT